MKSFVRGALGLWLTLWLSACGDSGSTPPGETAGFAGLGQTADEFAQARPGMTLSFPADHAAHPDYRIEWWYLTANLEAEHAEPLQ